MSIDIEVELLELCEDTFTFELEVPFPEELLLDTYVFPLIVTLVFEFTETLVPGVAGVGGGVGGVGVVLTCPLAIWLQTINAMIINTLIILFFNVKLKAQASYAWNGYGRIFAEILA